MIERATYRLPPAGHGVPPRGREYPAPDKKLRRILDTWLEAEGWEHDSDDFALEITKELDLQLAEVHALLLHYQAHPLHDEMGRFISALYHRVPERVIVFDLELEKPPSWLAYHSPSGKVFINTSTLGGATGWGASGPVINMGRDSEAVTDCSSAPFINYGEISAYPLRQALGPDENATIAERASSLLINLGVIRPPLFTGKESSGVIINYGTCPAYLGFQSSAMVINCGQAGDYMASAAKGIVLAVREPKSVGLKSEMELYLDQGRCARIPELGVYLETLRERFERGRGDSDAAVRALDDLGPHPEQRIRQDISLILTRAGYRRRVY
ncbi:MAG: hypothetical protein HY520_04420 [Candidatus Aenigmarchaeota archaeon]|nr:hypothetical protein [Candidatus Aenigmarchaeota archaeon]